MIDFLAPAYLWIKWLHLLALISWMAGLFYLPRLFVYHVESAPDDAKNMMETMELKLLKFIMTPAMIVTWITGLLLLLSPVVDLSSERWIILKILLVFGMTAFHGKCGKWRKQLAAGECDKTGRYFRLMNEVPTVLVVFIVGLVLFKPF